MTEAQTTNGSPPEVESKEKVSFLQEFTSSIVVFLVALPLCMGIALASGIKDPALGIVTGIVGGLIVGLFAGSPLQVSGPAAGLAVIVMELVREFGLPILGVLVLTAGAIQLLAGFLKLGRWFRAVSPAVIQGMLSGIGVLIFASQFHVMVDDDARKGGLNNLASIPASLYKGIFPLDGNTHHLAAYIGLITIITIVVWNVFRPKSLRMLPGPLLGLIVAIVVMKTMGWGIKTVPVPDKFIDVLNYPALGSFSKLLDVKFFFAAVAMAFIASAETLLCATAVDQMHQGVRTDYDKELMAQGTGNMICGALGALPMTGVIVRSSANVESGAKTRWSAVLHGLWLLLMVLAFPGILRMIPLAALAAILVHIGYKLMNFKGMVALWNTNKSEFMIYAITVVGIVGKDLLTGVLIGLGLSLIKLVYTFSHLDVKTEVSEDGVRADVYLNGAATFVRLPELAAALEKLPRHAELHIHLSRLAYIDHACLELISGWEKQMEGSGGSLIVEWEELRSRFSDKPIVEMNGSASKPATDTAT